MSIHFKKNSGINTRKEENKTEIWGAGVPIRFKLQRYNNYYFGQSACFDATVKYWNS